MSVTTEFPVTYQWYKDGAEIQGATDSVYDLPNAQESQSGDYSCLVSYDEIYGNWTDSITPLFFPNGPDTVQARLNFDFGEVVIDQALCELSVENAAKSSYLIYPNPTNGELNIKLSDAVKNAQVNVYSAKGALVLSDVFRGNRFNFDLSSVPRGVYLAEVFAENQIIHQRFVVY